MGVLVSGLVVLTFFLICAGLAWTNWLDTSHRSCGHRKVVLSDRRVALSNVFSNSVITVMSEPAKRLIPCQSSPTTHRCAGGSDWLDKAFNSRIRARELSWNSSAKIRVYGFL